MQAMHDPSGSKQPPLSSENKPRGANRSTKVAGKLKVLPEQPEHLPVLNKGPAVREPRRSNDTAVDSIGESEDGDVESSEENEREEEDVEACSKNPQFNDLMLINFASVYFRFTIKYHLYRMVLLAEMRLSSLRRKQSRSLASRRMQLRGKTYLPSLCPRTHTESCYSSYRMNELMKFFNARRNAYHANPKLIDDVLYTPYVYEIQSKDDSRQSRSEPVPTSDLLGIPELHRETPEDDDRTVKKRKSVFDTTAHEAEIFMFQYGTVVIWGMTEVQEKRFLASVLVFPGTTALVRADT